MAELSTLRKLRDRLGRQLTAEGYSSIKNIEAFEAIDLKVKKEEYKARRGLKIARGFENSPEKKTFNKSALQRRRRYKTRKVEELQEGKVIDVLALRQITNLPFWEALFPSKRGAAIELYYDERYQFKDFVGLYKEQRPDPGDPSQLIIENQERANTEGDLFRMMSRNYKKFNDLKIKAKGASLGTMLFLTDIILYKIDDIGVLDVTVNTEELKELLDNQVI